jgi:hypothetical protein
VFACRASWIYADPGIANLRCGYDFCIPDETGERALQKGATFYMLCAGAVRLRVNQDVPAWIAGE